MSLMRVTLVVVLWKHRLSLARLKKPANVRLIVIAPPRLIYDETNIDIFFQVATPIGDDFSELLAKAREVLRNSATLEKRVVAFERALQKPIAQIRVELDIEGLTPEALEQLFHLRDTNLVTRRGGLISLKHCSFGGMVPQPDSWVERAHGQVGRYPMFVKPKVYTEGHYMHTMCVIRNEHELRAWIRGRAVARDTTPFVLEECLENGHEFTALCTPSSGLIACVSTTEPSKTLFESVRAQTPYAIEFLSLDQTRDVLPGVESFVSQVIKSCLTRNPTTLFFIKGYYKTHCDIVFLGASLEPESATLASLLQSRPEFPPWEVVSLDSLLTNGSGIPAESLEAWQNASSDHVAVVNFPSSAGVLIHQTSIPRRRCQIRVAWRAAEGQEIADADSLDDNVLQVMLRGGGRAEVLEEIEALILETSIPIDRHTLIDRHNACRRNLSRLNQKELVRSCTTAD